MASLPPPPSSSTSAPHDVVRDLLRFAGLVVRVLVVVETLGLLTSFAPS